MSRYVVTVPVMVSVDVETVGMSEREAAWLVARRRVLDALPDASVPVSAPVASVASAPLDGRVR